MAVISTQPHGFKDSAGNNLVPGNLDADGNLKVAIEANVITGPISVADGADVTQGTTTNAAVVTDTSGTVIGFLRGLLVKMLVLTAQVLDYDTGAGTANTPIFGIALAASGGPVGVSSTNPLPVTSTSLGVTVANGANVVEGTTTDAAVSTDATGTIQQYLRGIVKLLAAKITVILDQTTPGTTNAVSLAQIGANTISAGAGAVGTGVQRTTLASDDPAVATLGATSGAKVITDANGTIQQYLRGIIYQMITAGVSFYTPTPDTVNGWTVFLATSSDGSTALTGTAQAIKVSAGKIGGWYIYNPNTVAIYVHLYNVAQANVTVGTTNPLVTLCIPASSAANLETVMGIPFSNAGFSCAATTTGGGNTAPTTALEAVFLYK